MWGSFFYIYKAIFYATHKHIIRNIFLNKLLFQVNLKIWEVSEVEEKMKRMA